MGGGGEGEEEGQEEEGAGKVEGEEMGGGGFVRISELLTSWFPSVYWSLCCSSHQLNGDCG